MGRNGLSQKFADDVVLLHVSNEELGEMPEELFKECEEVGLQGISRE